MSNFSYKSIEFDPFIDGQIQHTVPTTESQIEIWTSVQISDDANCAFNESISVKLTGKLDKKALEHSLEQLILRHDGLRTTFSSDGLTLIISTDSNFDFVLHDLSSFDSKEQIEQIRQLEALAAQTPFDLENGPLFRVALIREELEKHILLVTSHHIVCDGWSIWVILEELGHLYTTSSQNCFVELQTPFPFSMYAIEQNRRIDSEEWQNDEKFWVDSFTPPPLPLDLPTSFQRTAHRTFRANRKDYVFPEQLINQVKPFAAKQKTTLTVVFLSAFSAFLYRISGNDEAVIGVPASGQAASGHHYLIGHCINLLPLRCKLNDKESFIDYLQKYNQIMLDALEHQQYTYGSLLKKLRIPRDSGRPPLVSILFNIDQGLGDVNYGDLQVDYYVPPRSYENFELFLNASEKDGELHLQCQYNTDIFSESIIALRLKEFEFFIKQLISRPDQSLCLVPVIPPQEKKIFDGWNNTHEDLPADCVHKLIEQQAAQSPDKIAVIFGDETLTYEKLNQLANCMASYLKNLNIGPGDLAGIFLPRSLQMVVSLLAVWKTGAAYVPLDPNYPKHRIKYMVDNSAMVVIVTNNLLHENLPDSNAAIFNIDNQSFENGAQENIATKLSSENLAYVIYTSGSTGNPKGVKVHHRAVVNFLVSMSKKPGLSADDILLAVTTLSFDIAALEIFLPLICGATIALATAEESSDGFLLKQLMETFRPTVMQATPATWHMLLASEWAGSKNLKILCGGEAFPKALAEKLLPMCSQLWNMYGPTETTIWSTCFQIQDLDKPVLIGRPIDNTTIYILDTHLQPVPMGVFGELCIGGEGVTRGYLGRDNLTNQQFISNPIEGIEGELIYKTGDLVRMLEDGNIEYFNRLDNQVKIRGFRIELGEIEAAMESFPSLLRAAVKVIDASFGDSRLVAYFTASYQVSTGELRAHLRSLLPGYMIPQHIEQLLALPLTPAGKIDRKSLANPFKEVGDKGIEKKRKPETSTEMLLLDIWQKLIGFNDILLDDNFFDIGGHSLLATQAIARLRKNGYTINLRHFFEFPTIQAQAKMLENCSHSDDGLFRIKSHGFQEAVVLSLQQNRLWILEKLNGQSSVYNLPAAFKLFGSLDDDKFEQSIQKIFDRHLTLRTAIVNHGDSAQQYILPTYNFSLNKISLVEKSKSDKQQELFKIITEETAKPFALNQLPLFRAILFKMSPEEHAFFFMPHHAIWDGWSFDIFLKELRVNYEIACGVAHSPLPNLPVQYTDFSLWQQEWIESKELKNQLDYWINHLKDDSNVLALPTDNSRPPHLTYDNGASESLFLTKEKTNKLTSIAKQEQATLFMILLTSYALLLHHYAGSQRTIFIGTPISGRNNQDLTDLIGFFVNTLVIKIQIEPSMPFLQLLSEVRQTCLDAFKHQEIPFEKLIEALNPQRDTSRSPIFQVMFAYQDVRNRKQQINDLKLEQINIARSATQTDIDFWVRLSNNGIDGGFEYNADLFESRTIRGMIRHYENIIDAVIDNSSQPVSAIGVMSSDEQEQITSEYNNTRVQFEDDLPLPYLIDKQCADSPWETALIFNSKHQNYATLLEQANQWAHLLIDKGVQPKDIVGIHMERSDLMVTCLLGVLKTGAAYLPLDPYYPAERLFYMAEDGGVELVLTQSHLEESIEDIEAKFILTDHEDCSVFPKEPPSVIIDQEDLAYVIYTSGSTGKPKGVQVPHRALTNFLLSMGQEPGIKPEDRLLAVTTLSFDIAGLELFLPLISGATCVLSDRETSMDGLKLAKIIKKFEITIMQATPSTWRMMLAAGWKGSKTLKILCGGEAFPRDLIGLLIERCGQLWNMYGPTETTIWSTCFRITDANAPVSIGRPIANTQTYVLNESLQPTPRGVIGELYIGGTGVTHGYRNKMNLTQKQFVPNPFSNADDVCKIIYRTGDLVFQRKDGNIEYIERIDNQVKVRGHRIELSEIESVIANHPEVKQAVSIIRQEKAGDIRIIVYVVLTDNTKLDTNSIKNHTRQSLPDYMIPQHFVQIDTMPLTPAGKIDRKELSSKEIDHTSSLEDVVPPETNTEQKLYDIWCELLRLPQINIHDNFFDIGGHSMLAVSLFSKIKNIFQLELPLSILFQSPSIYTLASAIDKEFLKSTDHTALNKNNNKEEFIF